jgi:dephospho-CoA kinase
MGKTEAAKALKRLGVPVFNADEAVHRLYAKGGAAVKPVGALFPNAVISGEVNREVLRRIVFEDAKKLQALEAIVHPLVRNEEAAFLLKAKGEGCTLVVLEIPLLFETGAHKQCDKTALVTAPAFLQYMRAMRRPGMTKERLAAILARQMPDKEKRRRADYILHTGLHKGHLFRQVKAMVMEITQGS